jgi:hypothetical protein
LSLTGYRGLEIPLDWAGTPEPLQPAATTHSARPLTGIGVFGEEPVSGRARIVLDPTAGDLARGEVLVCRTTDPSWTPSKRCSPAYPTSASTSSVEPALHLPRPQSHDRLLVNPIMKIAASGNTRVALGTLTVANVESGAELIESGVANLGAEPVEVHAAHSAPMSGKQLHRVSRSSWLC